MYSGAKGTGRSISGSRFRVQGSGFKVQGSGCVAHVLLRGSGMGVRRVQDLVVWQLSREIERRVFAVTATSPAVGDRDYCLQIRKSSSSAARNIAEGFGRFRPREFARFVRIARGSLEETKDHL